MTTGRSLRLGEMVLAGGALALDLFIAVETAMLEVAPSQAAVGPRLFPSLVAAGLLLVGVALLREALFGHIAHEGGFELDWPVVGPRAGITGKLVICSCFSLLGRWGSSPSVTPVRR
jgi:putative tricarboxylic transport membrane protein